LHELRVSEQCLQPVDIVQAAINRRFGQQRVVFRSGFYLLQSIQIPGVLTMLSRGTQMIGAIPQTSMLTNSRAARACLFRA
jgi:hypothetical protein